MRERAWNEELRVARERLEASVREAHQHREQATLLFREAGDGILGIDRRGTITEMNPAALRMFGYSAEEILGQNVKILMPEPHSSRHDEYLRRYRGTGSSRALNFGRELPARRRDGSTLSVEIVASEVSQAEYGTRFVGFVRDITDRLRVEQERRRAHEELERRVVERTAELERSNRELENFAYVASTTCRSPCGSS